ncbi:flagellar biosynthetic protein FliR [Plastorhodobacter daqingensis]|uniref:Flagellar biosynthetic protein FliR n=1 Tax=Plastorhodobacter daqingensis TaxID=1387281 RepID=A0ABW2UDG3_9RHOB
MTPELASALLAITGQSQEWLLAGFFIFLRVGAAVAVLPVFGDQAVPQRVRLGAALAFTLVLLPLAEADLAPLVAAGRIVTPAVATEVIAGLLLGLALRLFVMVLQIAGTIAAQSTSLAQFFGGAGVDPQPAIAQVFLIGGVALAVMSGLHVRLAEAFLLSYQMLPPGRFPLPGVVSEWGVMQVARAFSLAFILSAPFVIAALVYNLALGAINKAMPQLMVAFVGAPALTLGGLLLLLVVTPVLLSIWHEAFQNFLGDPFGAAR